MGRLSSSALRTVLPATVCGAGGIALALAAFSTAGAATSSTPKVDRVKEEAAVRRVADRFYRGVAAGQPSVACPMLTSTGQSVLVRVSWLVAPAATKPTDCAGAIRFIHGDIDPATLDETFQILQRAAVRVTDDGRARLRPSPYETIHMVQVRGKWRIEDPLGIPESHAIVRDKKAAAKRRAQKTAAAKRRQSAARAR